MSSNQAPSGWPGPSPMSSCVHWEAAACFSSLRCRLNSNSSLSRKTLGSLAAWLIELTAKDSWTQSFHVACCCFIKLSWVLSVPISLSALCQSADSHRNKQKFLAVKNPLKPCCPTNFIFTMTHSRHRVVKLPDNLMSYCEQLWSAAHGAGLQQGFHMTGISQPPGLRSVKTAVMTRNKQKIW